MGFEDQPVRRLIARLLLLTVTVGLVAPFAAALAPQSQPDHCVRMAAEHCHHATPTRDSDAIRPGAEACSHDCCRSVTVSPHSAHPGVIAFTHVVARVESLVLDADRDHNPVARVALHSGRAPPVSEQ